MRNYRRTFVRGSRGSVDLNVKVSEVVLMGNGTDARNSKCLESETVTEVFFQGPEPLTARSSTAQSP
jgi:hypothetical protein